MSQLPVTESSVIIEQVINHLKMSNISSDWGKMVKVTVHPNPNGIDDDSPVWDSLWHLVRHHYSEIFCQLDNELYLVNRYAETPSTPDLVAKHREANEIYHKVVDIDLSDLIDSVGGDLVNKSGKFGKRFMKEFKRLSGLNLPNEVVSKIGNTVNESMVKDAESFYVDVTNNFSWQDGDFGHSGSCWFDPDQYPASRDSLLGVNGYAMRRFTEQGYDKGRVWFIPSIIDDQEVFILFNAYGYKGEISQTGHILAQLIKDATGIEYKSTSCDFESDYSSSAMYLNPGKRIVYPATLTVTHDSEFTMRIRKIEGYYFDEIMSNSNDYFCEICEDRVDESDIIMHNGIYYCESCFDESFTSCHHCGDYVQLDDALISNANYDYCESCYNEIYTRCESCDCEIEQDDSIIIGDTTYCEDCANDRTYACDDCGDRIDHSEIHMTHDNEYGYCDSCWDDHTFTCPSCQQQLELSQLARDDNSTHFTANQKTESYLDNTQDYNPNMLCVRCFEGRPVITSNQMRLFELA